MPSENAATLVEETVAAIEDDDFSLADSKLTAASGVLDDIAREEVADERRIRAARNSNATSLGKTEQLDDYLRQLNGTRMLRSSFLAAAAAYLIDPLADDASTITDLGEDLVESERDAAAKVGDARDVADAVDLPATPTVVEAEASDTAVLVGQSLTVSVTVRNVGDEPATAVTVTVDAEDGLAPDVESLAFDTLPPGGEGTRTVEVSTTAPGESSISLGLGPAEPADTPAIAVSVAERTRITNDMLTSITTVEERLKNASLDEATRTSLQAKLDTARTRVKEAKQLFKNGQTADAKEAVKAANVALGDFLNAVAGLDDGAIESTRRRAFDRLTTNGIEQTGPLLKEPSGLAAYANDSGIITESGLTEAVDDWVNREIETALLRKAIDAWRAETVVTST
ncbi:MAG: CARDB domain-containing protein [Haloplanus sp.]